MSKIANLDFSALKSNGDNYLEWTLDAKIMLRSKDLGDTITEDNNSSDKDKLCGEKVTEEEMLNKTLSTFPQTNMVLQQQYRERNFATYTELIECLLLAEANNELLLKNSEMRPPGTTPLPDISKMAIEPKKGSNLVQHNDHPGPNRGRSQGRGCGSFKAHGRGRGRGTTPGFSRGRGRGRSVSFKPQIKADRCHRCGMGNHWAKNCRIPKHFCDLYTESLKRNPEANMVRDPGYDDDDDDDLEDVQDHQHESDKVDHMEFETSDILK
ncbi:uncharacterized protein LOC106403632 [Brassica napus]|uniref:uncharacterized protein LOC106403632 n=1 Tax=Brassica napus TaxID=3708 RepID=UPI00207A4F09|nr:uncharacterized protein LOC106403632 [Brassica napus]